MLEVKANKKMVQQHIFKQSGKVVILKDLHNLASKDKRNEVINVSTLVEEMKKVNGKQIQVKYIFCLLKLFITLFFYRGICGSVKR